MSEHQSAENSSVETDLFATPTSPTAERTEAKLVPQALAQFVMTTVPPVALGLGALYIVFGVAHLFTIAEAGARLTMTVAAFISSLSLLAIAYGLRDRLIRTEWAHFWVMVVAIFVLLNSWLHLVLTRDPLQSTNFMLLVVGTGVFFLSTRWFISFLLLTWFSWLVALYLSAIPVDNQIVHYVFGLVSASLLAILAHSARKARLIRLTRLHHQDQERALHLQAALESSGAQETALRTSETRYRELSSQLEEQAEALRVANQSLASASKLKDEFLASMSHELRTPLTAILGITESLKEQIYGPVSERQTRALNNVIESGNHLLDLINDVLDVAKTEAGKLELDIVPADAHMVAEASVRFVQQSAKDKQITIHLEADAQVKLLMADERRLKQMLINLLSNAVKFTGEGGEIGLELTGDWEHRAVRFSVWDTGIGIDEEQMSRLFKPFIQLDSRLSRRYGGTGLGLVLVYRMAEMHGGSIGVESCPGQGSRFTVTLPWREADLHIQPFAGNSTALDAPAGNNGSTNGSSAAATITPPSSQHKLLVVDDHHWSRKWMENTAASMGYEVSLTDATSDLQQSIAHLQPNFILLDIQMPPHDSLALIRSLHREKGNAPTPIIAVSALAMPDQEKQAKAAGADAYLLKPISSITLCKTVAALTKESNVA